jgi:hypothetical protein
MKLDRQNDYQGRSKIFESLEDMVRCVVVDERKWFRDYQPQLLELANSEEGRAVLCVDFQHRVDRIAHNRVEHWDGTSTASEFRVGTKYGNVARYRFPEVVSAMRAVERSAERRASRMGVRFHKVGELASPSGFDLGAALGFRPLALAGLRMDNITRYPQTGSGGSNVTCDGMLDRFTAPTTFEDTRSAVSASTVYTSGSSLEFVRIYYYSPESRWRIMRTYETFDTSSIGSNNVNQASISNYIFYKSNGIGSLEAKPYLVSLASNNSLTINDYNKNNFAASSMTDSGYTYNGVTTNTYNTLTLNSTGKAAINKTGVTPIGWRDSVYDVSGTSPSLVSGDSQFQIHTADYIGTTDDPKLYVEYSAAAGGSGLLTPSRVW